MLALTGVAQVAALRGVDTSPDFELAGSQRAAPFILETGIDPAVVRAADDVRADIERVTGRTPDRLASIPGEASQLVIVGVAGQSATLERLQTAKKIDLTALVGAWETFVVAVVDNPLPGVERALVIAGSDRRGAIYGLYEISNLIGVSPWTWWADVRVPKKDRLIIPAGTRVVGPPSVKYRGIFINDEDWGLLPWSAETFEPEVGNMGPKTYGKIFELVLRLRGNLVWPGMHPTTRAFNYYAKNKEVADAYGVVMGSSHAEPMLRNNVDEWKAPEHDYDYIANRKGVLSYWEERVASNARFENVYTLGMRGIHDSRMIGPRDNAERVRTLEKIFSDQRSLLARYVRPDVEQVPQMFCAYKEVLELYRLGLQVPGDVTLVWPDDNFGYIRAFPSEVERARKGGSGVYYHLSYLGHPLSYLWLATTPPALIWQQMNQAYEYGADRLWIANVGDIKPGEIATEFFLQMAWDVKKWKPDNLPQFLKQWAAREFGPEHAEAIAEMLSQYYVLNFQRKPEHLQWWLPGQPRQPSSLTDEEVKQRLEAFSQLRQRSELLRDKLPTDSRDAYYELVHYPISGAALANERYFLGEQGKRAQAEAAHAALVAEARTFNEVVASGKWRGMVSLEPADEQWSTMRIAPWAPFDHPRPSVPSPAPGSYVALAGGDFVRNSASGKFSWRLIPGLGRTGKAVTVLPSVMSQYEGTSIAQAPYLEYEVQVPRAGQHTIELQLLPTHPLNGRSLRMAVSVGDEPPRAVTLEVGENRAWSQGVLAGSLSASIQMPFASPGRHKLKVFGTDAGVVLDQIIVNFDAQHSTYLGPTVKQIGSGK
ncbi:MAG: glycosyl hydrolase 115 family protein [Nibricoccus sp.]